MVRQPLIRFAAGTSIALYIALLFAEYLRPGFVSTVMNVHAMWAVMVPLVLATPLHPLLLPLGRGRVLSGIALLVLGTILALIVWHLGEVFGGMRFWFAVAVGITPLALFRYSR